MKKLMFSFVAALMATTLWSSTSSAATRLDSIQKITPTFNNAAKNIKPASAAPIPRHVPEHARGIGLGGGGGGNAAPIVLNRHLPPPPNLTIKFNKAVQKP